MGKSTTHGGFSSTSCLVAFNDGAALLHLTWNQYHIYIYMYIYIGNIQEWKLILRYHGFVVPASCLGCTAAAKHERFRSRIDLRQVEKLMNLDITKGFWYPAEQHVLFWGRHLSSSWDACNIPHQPIPFPPVTSFLKCGFSEMRVPHLSSIFNHLIVHPTIWGFP